MVFLTKLDARNSVTIPKDIRNQMDLLEGEIIAVLKVDDNIVLMKYETYMQKKLNYKKEK